MGLSGLIGAGAGEGLLELLAQRRLAEQLAAQEAERAHGRRMDSARLDETKRRNRFDEDRVQRQDQLSEADALASTLSAGFDPTSPLDVEVSAGDAAKLAGTPQGARVREIPMIDAKPIVPGMSQMGPQGVGVRRLTPDAAQQGARRVVGLRKRVSGELAGATSEDQRRQAAAGAFAEGVNVPDSLMRPSLQETTAADEAARQRDLEDFAAQERIRASHRPRPGGDDQVWVIRNGQPTPIAKGTAQPGDMPYDAVQTRADARRNEPSGYAIEAATRMVSKIDSLEPRISKWTTGVVGKALSSMPIQTEARDFAADLESLAADIAYNELQKMRQNSPTGGAVGQVSDFETRLLSGVIASVRQDQSAENLRRNFTAVRESAARILEAANKDAQVSGALGEMRPMTSRDTGAPTESGGEWVFNPRTGKLEKQ